DREHDHVVAVQALHHLRLLSFVFGREVRHLDSPLPVNFTPYAVHRARRFSTRFAILRMWSAANWPTWTSGPTSRRASRHSAPRRVTLARRRRASAHPMLLPLVLDAPSLAH